jgi:hypothetical protein
VHVQDTPAAATTTTTTATTTWLVGDSEGYSKIAITKGDALPTTTTTAAAAAAYAATAVG